MVSNPWFLLFSRWTKTVAVMVWSRLNSHMPTWTSLGLADGWMSGDRGMLVCPHCSPYTDLVSFKCSNGTSLGFVYLWMGFHPAHHRSGLCHPRPSHSAVVFCVVSLCRRPLTWSHLSQTAVCPELPPGSLTSSSSLMETLTPVVCFQVTCANHAELLWSRFCEKPDV